MDRIASHYGAFILILITRKYSEIFEKYIFSRRETRGKMCENRNTETNLSTKNVFSNSFRTLF